MTQIPYGRQTIDEQDIEAVVEVLRSDYLTSGPKVIEFEQAMAAYCGTEHAVALSSGTAALHAVTHALDLGPGDEVIVPAITFAATANAVLYMDARPVFADILPDTLLIDPADVARKITPRTKAVIAVDYAGQLCDYQQLRRICQDHGLHLIADSCHALGANRDGQGPGQLADLAVFSFHPVKHIATGEGGMVITNDSRAATRIQQFRNHGIDTDHRQRSDMVTHCYDMTALGYNYRLTDIQCALGLSQLRKLPEFLKSRRRTSLLYDALLSPSPSIHPLSSDGDAHAHHLYVVRLSDQIDRDQVFRTMRANGIGVNVHYRPVYLHTHYRRLGYEAGLCPRAEDAYEHILTLPLYPALEEKEVQFIVRELERACQQT